MIKEIVIKPSQMYYMLRNVGREIDYNSYIENEEFINDYMKALNNLSGIEKDVMQLFYDNNVSRSEIGEYLGLELNQVKNNKQRDLIKLRKDNNLNSYL